MSEKKQFYKMVFALVIPMALQNLINVGVSAADVAMLGKVGETALSASSLGGQLGYIMSMIFFGLTSGACVLTAQYWGKGDVKTIEKVMGIALRISLLIGVTFTIAAWVFPYEILDIFSNEADVIESGVQYLRIVSISYIFISITMVYLNIMRSVEKVVISTVVYLISLCINVILNAILIFGLFGLPAMGIRGAAIATVTARIVEFIIVIIYAKNFNKVINFRIRDIFVRDSALFKDFVIFSIPVTINELMWGLGTSANTAIIGNLGKAAVSANSVAQVARQLATVIAFGIATAAAIVLGKAIGENKLDRAKEYSKRFIKLSIAAGIIGGIIIVASKSFIVQSMQLSDDAVRYMSVMMFVMGYFVIAQAYNATLVVGVFRAGGDTVFGAIIDVGGMWCGSILLGFIAAFILDLSVPIVYILLMSDELIKVPITTWRYKKGIWLRNVTRS